MRTDILGMKSMPGKIKISVEGLEDKLSQRVEYEKKGEKHFSKDPTVSLCRSCLGPFYY